MPDFLFLLCPDKTVQIVACVLGSLNVAFLDVIWNRLCAAQNPQKFFVCSCDKRVVVFGIKRNDFVVAVKRPKERDFQASGILVPGEFRLSHGLFLLFADIIIARIYNLDSAVFVQRVVGRNVFQIFFPLEVKPADFVPFSKIPLDLKIPHRFKVFIAFFGD